MKYKYLGGDERHLPLHGLNVKPGETVETDLEINNPDFELVKEDDKKELAE